MLKHKDKNEIMEVMAEKLSDKNYMNFKKTASKKTSDNKLLEIYNYVKTLVSVADKMDSVGFSKQATQIDYIVKDVIELIKLSSDPFNKAVLDYIKEVGRVFENCNIKKAEEFIRYVIQGRDEPSHFIYGPFMTEEEAKVWGWWTWAGDSAEEQFRTITYGEEWEYLLRQQDPKTREVDEESSKLFPIDKLPLWQSYFIKQYAKDGRLSFGQLKSAINEVLSGDHGNGKNRSGDPGLNLALDVLYVLRERGLAKQFGEY